MRTTIKSIIKSKREAMRKKRYHRNHYDQVVRILNNLERHSKFKLSYNTIQHCDTYAANKLGDKHFAPWLYVYSAICGEFKEGWIPDNYYGAVVVPKVNGAYGMVASMKPMNSAIFASKLFPDILSYANGIFFDPHYRYVPKNKVSEQLFSNRDRVIFKLDHSQQGKGIHFIDKDSFNVDAIPALGNGLFQSVIKQHPVFDDLAKESVATLRVTTVIENTGNVSIRACYLRLGNTDDTHVQSNSHIRVPINLTTGEFSHIGYTPEWIAIDKHPTSGAVFDGHVVPDINSCFSKVIELHKKAPYARCIGWDIAINDESQINIMEWNAGHNDIKFSEATQGPCFSDLPWSKLHKIAS